MLLPHFHLLVVKNPALQALLGLLLIIFTIAWMVGFWINTGAIKDARQSGYRFWLINPRAVITGYRKMNWKLYLWSMLIGGISIAAALAIHFYADEAQVPAWPTTRPIASDGR
jgi:hypothetical protein